MYRVFGQITKPTLTRLDPPWKSTDLSVRYYPPGDRALALVLHSGRMFERTFFITTVTSSRKPLFRSVRPADLFIQTMYEYRRQGKLLVHEFVLMPDHLHMLLTLPWPSP